MIPIGNVYYMLAYAFRVLRQSGYADLGSEDFENADDLCAAILERAVSHQLKRGLGRGYVPREDAIATVRGRIHVGESAKTLSTITGRLVCDYDEFSEDVPMNRVVKAAMRALLGSPDVPAHRKGELRRLLPYFSGVREVNLRRADWRFRYDRNSKSYEMLMFVCKLVADRAVQRDAAGRRGLAEFGDDQEISRLYEKFILAYYKREHPELRSSAAQVPWALDDGEGGMLPVMQTDVTLQQGDRILIIDAKYYQSSLQQRYSARTVHSGNLYQIFAYVKNEQAALPSGAPPVSGMLLYAKTDEEVFPHNCYLMSGNPVEVRTLDLSGDFSSIKRQLDGIAEEHFAQPQTNEAM
jgi:5-methylcytosine-specific restriction enzyme subunit McrC